MLVPRLLCAIVAIPLILALIHFGALPFLAFVTGIAALALYEFGLILWLGGRGVQRWIMAGGGTALALTVGLGTPDAGIAHGSMTFMVLSMLVMLAMLRELLRKDHSLDRAALTLLGALFIGWGLGHLALLRDLRPYGERLTFFLFLTVWLADTAAYAAGRGLGRRKLSPLISPKKTWEGAVAGLGASLGFAAFAQGTFLSQALSMPQALAAGLFIGAMGQCSDLAESLVKRAAGVKDSSQLLPGHGGILDRFDTFLLTVPVLYYALALKFR